MTSEEFKAWSRRLFVAYPSLGEWLNRNSPDPTATLELWRKTLEPYTSTECHRVLDNWELSSKMPFQAYEKDQVHRLVRATIELAQDRVAKREALAVEKARRQQTRVGSGQGIAQGVVFSDSAMSAALAEGIPLQRKYEAGELTYSEFAEQRAALLEKHGI